jgi:uncharacterized cupredoxin-like copper-binding protein
MVVSMMSFVPAAFGHGESGQGKPKAIDYSKAEEVPFGRAGNPKKVGRTIRVGMDDSMHFSVTASARPDRTTDARIGDGRHAMVGDIVVKRGETVRFVVRNDGKLMHEMVIGTMKDLKEHAELMRKFPAMEHDEPYMAHVAPGTEGEIVWQFTRAGEFHYACLVLGHMEAGMIAKITVK